MQALSILGSEANAVAEELAARLDGRVALVKHARDAHETAGGSGASNTASGASDTAPGTTAVAEGQSVTDAVYALTEGGAWTGAGTDRDIDDFLELLAPDVEYLIVAGHNRLRLPTVLVGTTESPADVPGDVIHSVEEAADVDYESLASEIDAIEPWITLSELVAEAKASPNADRSGAIATFTGRVRAKDSPDDDRTSHLAFETYEGVAGERMDAIARELTERDGVLEVLMHHRTGVIPDGEDIVFVVVLAGHRREAFDTVEAGINRLKDEVPIFKKETTESEEFWVHERE